MNVREDKIFWSKSPRKNTEKAGPYQGRRTTKQVHFTSSREASVLEMKPCKFCGAEIDFVKSQLDKWIPINPLSGEWHKCKGFYNKIGKVV